MEGESSTRVDDALPNLSKPDKTRCLTCQDGCGDDVTVPEDLAQKLINVFPEPLRFYLSILPEAEDDPVMPDAGAESPPVSPPVSLSSPPLYSDLPRQTFPNLQSVPGLFARQTKQKPDAR